MGHEWRRSNGQTRSCTHLRRSMVKVEGEPCSKLEMLRSRRDMSSTGQYTFETLKLLYLLIVVCPSSWQAFGNLGTSKV